ncbi:DUF2071 domain-containing protein [Neolewinella lacunae]|uniref:DUF2071 domain-containing protein n=1 Tax=Neolewinella lacunae TaxID=1517758 RepID=A0A923T896_9BACT|nr:DUF2071 domain-containing protein [Neolewinella lacunae]MBC6994329.1 DUF2071 domain-containing protein [Neolewinella lacunae]MDN3635824.1 DUF2071 domain-containing protein [Neolewinella lacunae]
MRQLKNHPFAVSAHFVRSTVLTFALPPEDLAPLLPPPLSLDTFQDRHAFVAVAMVETKALRPKGFPAILGNDFFLIGYRIFVRYADQRGKGLRGLYILRSETDRKRMTWLGNTFTHYNYRLTDVKTVMDEDRYSVFSHASKLDVAVSDNASGELPAGSPFSSWKEARRFAGPLPFTFTYEASTQKVLIIEGVRENWTPRPLTVERQQVGWLGEAGFGRASLANAFSIENVPYSWKKGRTEVWKP